MTRLRVWNLIWIALAFSACTEKGKPYSPNAPAVHRYEDSFQFGDSNEKDPPATTKTVVETENRARNARDPLQEVIVPLATRVLAPARITDKKSPGLPLVLDELRLLNRLVVQLSPTERQRPEFRAVIALYQAAADVECRPFRESCAGMRYLELAETSSPVFRLLSEENPALHYHDLLVALELKNDIWDQKLIELYIKSKLNGGGPTKDDQVDRKALDSHFQSAIQTMSDRADRLDPKDLRRFLDQIHAWNLVRAPGLLQESSTHSALLSMMNRAGYLYAENHALHPEFKAQVDVAFKAENNFLALQERVKKTTLFPPGEIEFIAANQYNEVIFVADEVFHDRLSADEGANILGMSQIPDLEKVHLFQIYMRLQFISQVHEAAVQAQTFYNQKVAAEALWDFAQQQSSSVAKLWKDFRIHADSIHLLARKSQSATPQQTDGGALDALDQLFSSLDHSINMSSTVPQEMTLLYFLGKKSFLVGQIFIKIDSSYLLWALFSSNIPAIFSYSNETAALNLYQNVYAFDIGLRTGAFTAAGIDPDAFIAQTMTSLNGIYETEIRTTLQRIEAGFAANTLHQDLINACQELTTHVPVSRTFYFQDIALSPYYGRILDLAFSPVWNGDAPQGTNLGEDSTQEKMGSFFLDMNFAEAVEKARIGAGNNLRIGEALLEDYKTLLQQQGLKPEEVKRKTAKSTQALQNIKDLRLTFFDKAKSLYKELGNCYWPLIKKQNDVQDQVVEAEKIYLRTVYRLLKELKQSPNPDYDGAMKELRAQLNLQFPPDFHGYDGLGPDGYSLDQVELYFRFASYLTSGIHTHVGHMEAIAPQIRITYGEKIDPLNMGFVQMRKHEVVQWTQTEEEFVNAGLNTIFNTNAAAPMISWYESVRGMDEWSVFLNSMTALYRYERELTDKSITFTAKELLTQHENMSQVVTLTKNQRALFQVLHKNQRFDSGVFSKKLLTHALHHMGVDRLWGLFDLMYEMATGEQLGRMWGYSLRDHGDQAVTEDTTGMKTGKDYFNARATAIRGASFIPYNQALDQNLDASVGHFVRNDLQARNDFEKGTKAYIDEIRQRPLNQPRPRADITVNVAIDGNYLTDSLTSSYAGKLDTFMSDTHRCFSLSATSRCADFAK